MRAAALLALVAVGGLVLLWMRSGQEGRAGVHSPESARADDGPSSASLLASVPPEPERERAPEEPVASAISPREAEPPASATPTDALVGCVLHGRVRTTDGRAFAGWKPYVSATDSAGLRRHTEVSGEGHYALAGLAPGRWSLSYGGTGFRLGREELELARSEPIVRRDLTLEPSPLLEVRVLTPEGETFWKAQRARGAAGLRTPDGPIAVATLEPPGATIEEARDADQNPVGVGSFWTHGPLVDAAGPGVHGVLELQADPPLFVSLVVGARVVSTQPVAAGERAVTFVVRLEDLLEQLAQVTMRFVADDTGAPLTGEVWLDSRTTFNVREGTWTATLLPGKHSFFLWAQGYARVPFEIEPQPGQELDLGEQRIPRELTIAGRLLDADGRPVVGRLEIGLRDAAGKLRIQDDWMYESDASGAFLIYGLLPGRYVVRTVGDDQVVFPHRDEPPTEWVTGNVEVSTLGGSVTGLELRCARAGILVLKGAETLAPESRCKVLDERGDVLRYSAFYPGFVPRFALPPGPCTFVLCDGEWNELRRWSLTIVPGVTELGLGP